MAPQEREQFSYADLDPFKVIAQRLAAETSRNIDRLGFQVVDESRGESALVIDEGDRYSAHVVEGLGTKNLVADAMRRKNVGEQLGIAYQLARVTDKTFYDQIGQCAVATIVNDLIPVGATPVQVSAYCAVGSPDWLTDKNRAEDLLVGFARGCDLAGAVYGGGETPALKGIIDPHTIDIAGSGYGIIRPKERLALGNKINPGDAIFMLESNGVHANGLSDARRVAERIAIARETSVARVYETRLADGRSYGESLLDPTHIYAKVIESLFEEGLDLHYMVNLTGHGWRKLMRASRDDLSYVVDRVPQPQPVFNFIQRELGWTNTQMYGTYNMGGGFAIMMPEDQIRTATEVASEHGMWGDKIGTVQKGSKQVYIKPLDVLFGGESLGVR